MPPNFPPVAVACWSRHAARSRRELLVAEQVQRLAVPGHLLQVPRYAQAADLTRRDPVEPGVLLVITGGQARAQATLAAQAL